MTADISVTGGVTVRTFHKAGGSAEHFVTVAAPAGLPFAEQLGAVKQRYAQALHRLGLAPGSAVFRRLFVSDILNQRTALEDGGWLSDDAEGGPVAVSVVQQAPLDGSKIALLAYHVAGGVDVVKRRLSPQHLLIEKNGLGHLWSTRLCAASRDDHPTAEAQTRQVFEDLIGRLGSLGGNLLDHCVRTWIYIKDIDVFYASMVKSRTALFQRENLTAETHYIASTGIEAAGLQQFDVVLLDAYSILGLRPEQMSFLADVERMCPTKDYNVTFERGTRIGYADRAHHFISGTASIDHTGAVLHRGDVLAQLDRAVGNIDAILRSGGASLADMMYAIVYLRDRADFPAVRARLESLLPGVPMVVVEGAVCRPEWLIELEGVAVAANEQPQLPGF